MRAALPIRARPRRLGLELSLVASVALSMFLFPQSFGIDLPITALAATLPTVISRRRSGSSPTTSPDGRPECSINSSTRCSVGGTTGRPSVQPNS